MLAPALWSSHLLSDPYRTEAVLASLQVGVRFDHSVSGGINLGGLCPEGFGFFCNTAQLVLESSSERGADGESAAIGALFDFILAAAEAGPLVVFFKVCCFPPSHSNIRLCGDRRAVRLHPDDRRGRAAGLLLQGVLLPPVLRMESWLQHHSFHLVALTWQNRCPRVSVCILQLRGLLVVEYCYLHLNWFCRTLGHRRSS